MKYIYVVNHVNPKDNDDKYISAYSSYQEAQEVVEKYKSFNGFKNSPDNFYIDKYELDKKYWAEGYYSVRIKNKN